MNINLLDTNIITNEQFVKNNNQNKQNKVTFTSSIPGKYIKDLGDIYKTKARKLNTNQDIFDASMEYFDKITSKLNIIKPKDTLGIVRLFYHELINTNYAKLQLDLNPAFQESIELVSPKQEKNKFYKIINNINNMTQNWSMLENWKEHETQNVKFKDIITLLKSLINKEKNNIKINVSSNINGNDSIPKAFNLYNILSQVILNSIKYSESKPISIGFKEYKNGKCIMTVLNHDTQPISNDNIEKIIQGEGYRASENISGTGTGYKEIVKELTMNGYDSKDIIEKDRTSGVKVSIPFKLNKN